MSDIKIVQKCGVIGRDSKGGCGDPSLTPLNPHLTDTSHRCFIWIPRFFFLFLFFWSIKWTKILQSNSKLVEMRWPSSQQHRFKRKAATRWKKFCIKHSKMHYSALIRFWIMEKKLTLQGAVCKTLSLAPRSSNTDAVGREVGEVRPILHSTPLKIQHAGFPCCHVKAGSVWNKGEKNVHFYSTDFLSYLPKWARNKI